MATTATEAASRVQRCAVCKVDLRGRLVYIDEEAEMLLGGSQVDLFGQPFNDFLEKSDHDLFSQVTSSYNRYETFFSCCHLTLTNLSNQKIPATVAFSLNFNAGNPVNYQVVIIPDSTIQESVVTREETTPSEILDSIAHLSRIESDPEIVAGLIRQLISADRVTIREADDQSRVLAIDHDSSIHFDTPDIQGLSLESSITCTCAGGTELTVLAETFDANLERAERIERRLGLLRQILAPSEPLSENTQPNMANSQLLDLLDLAGIGVVTLDQSGATETNSVGAEYVGELPSPCSLELLGQHLVGEDECARTELIASLQLVLDPDGLQVDSRRITRPDRSALNVTAFKTSSGDNPRIAVLLYPQGGTTSGERLAHETVENAITRLADLSNKSQSNWQQLYASRPSHDQSRYKRVDALFGAIQTCLIDISSALRLAALDEQEREADISRFLYDQKQRFEKSVPGLLLDIDAPEEVPAVLPWLKTQALLDSVTQYLVRWGNSKVEVKLDASNDSEAIKISYRFKPLPGGNRNLKRSVDLFANSSSADERDIYNWGPALWPVLAEHMGHKLEVCTSEKDLSGVMVWLKAGKGELKK